jgi:hypothetical protein
MSLCFPYSQEKIVTPAIALGGRMTRPRPIIDVTLINQGQTRFARGLLDTGADDTIFPEWLAVGLGIDLTRCPVGQGTGVGGQSIPVRFATVTLRITDGIEYLDWNALVGFSAARAVNALLGFAGFLQYFTVTFHGDDEMATVEHNRLYPGTSGAWQPFQS